MKVTNLTPSKRAPHQPDRPQELPAVGAPARPPHLIHPLAVYTLPSARSALGLAKSSLNREIRLKRLRVARRGGRYFILGEWLLAWLRGGEVGRRETEPTPEPVAG
jgi:hypothetical protein